jgi:RNA polymerase sigma factor (sigma-70 family)
MPSDRDDATLVRAARGGDKVAFGALFERHRPLLLTLCRRVLGNPASAEDAAQEAALAAFLNLNRLRQPDRFGPWLAGIGLNVCRRWLRTSSNNPWSREDMVGGRRVNRPLDLVDERPGPEELAEEADLARRVRRAVADLPRGQRAAIALFYLAGLTHAETAAALGIEVNSVKQRLHKARATLRRQLTRGTGATVMVTSESSDLVEMRIADVRRVPPEGDRQLQYIVVLEEIGGTRRLPIWIGTFEGEAIAIELEKVALPRPMTFRFAASLLQAAGGRAREVVISRLADNVFYAEVVISRSGKTQVVDCRPSDALNLALLLGAPIRARAAVIEAAAQPVKCLPSPPDPFGEGTEGAKEIAAAIRGNQPGFK